MGGGDSTFFREVVINQVLPIRFAQLVTGSDTGFRQGVLHPLNGGHRDGISDDSA
jgi:hypothetical protein